MLSIGKPAPDFKAAPAYQAGEFRSVSLSEYRGQWLVLFFYPRDFTFVCPTELRGFAARQKELEDLGAKIIAVSTDSQWSHKAWFERDLPEVKYPVVADTSLKLAEAYDVLNAADGSAERGLFVIDPEGIVRYIVVSASSVGRSVQETMRVLRALKSGELCPLDWKAGEATLGKAK